MLFGLYFFPEIEDLRIFQKEKRRDQCYMSTMMICMHLERGGTYFGWDGRELLFWGTNELPSLFLFCFYGSTLEAQGSYEKWREGIGM